MSKELIAAERTKLAAEIAALEQRLADEEEEVKFEEEVACKASLQNPNGPEEQITQKSLTEVQDLKGQRDLATKPSLADVVEKPAPKAEDVTEEGLPDEVVESDEEFAASMRQASARLDKIADYLEKSGRKALAYRIDKISDAIDARIR